MLTARASARLGLIFAEAEGGAAIEHPAAVAPGDGAMVLRIAMVKSGRFIDPAGGFCDAPEPPPMPEPEVAAPAEVQPVQPVETFHVDDELAAIAAAGGETTELGRLLAAAREEKRHPRVEPDGRQIAPPEVIRAPSPPPVRLAMPPAGAAPAEPLPSASGMRVVTP
ncbi:MAG: hypothetical protein OEL76_10715 [Siculibacillus sp.]|nr:hypothetical protein [Siculibacillus sp.]